MRNSDRTYWVIAAGDGKRDYSDVFLRYGIMLIGPGDQGSYFDNPENYRVHHKEVKWFAEDVKPGHIIILKRAREGVVSIIAAGIVDGARGWVDDERESGYFHSEIFGNVEGFSLQHGRYVTWYELREEVIPKHGLASRSRPLLHPQQDNIKQIAERIIAPPNRPRRPEKIPPPANPVKDEKLIRNLIEGGLSSGEAENVIRAFMRVRRLGRWYEDHWEERADADEDISEHETRTFLIIPLLLALGWPEQRLKIEWKNIDIAFFESNYRSGDSPIMILESKKLYDPLLWAEEQAKEYAEKFPNCKKLVVSNGIRYLLFQKEKNEWIPNAYLDLLKIRDRHPYYQEIKGAPNLLKELLP